MTGPVTGPRPAHPDHAASQRLSALERLVAQGRATAPTIGPDEPLPMPPVLGDPSLDTAQELAAAREHERW